MKPQTKFAAFFSTKIQAFNYKQKKTSRVLEHHCGIDEKLSGLEWALGGLSYGVPMQ